PCPRIDTHSTPQPSRTQAPPYKDTCRRDVPLHPLPSRLALTHHRERCTPDAQRRCAQQFLHQRTLIREPSRVFDRRTDREGPCPAEHIVPARNRQLMRKEYVQLQATSSHRCSHGMEPPLE